MEPSFPSPEVKVGCNMIHFSSQDRVIKNIFLDIFSKNFMDLLRLGFDLLFH